MAMVGEEVRCDVGEISMPEILVPYGDGDLRG